MTDNKWNNLAVVEPETDMNAIRWQLDPLHSAAHFSVRHMMVSNVRGQFKLTGSVTVDPHDFRNSTVEALIDASTIDTREPARDKHLRSADFFDAANYPTLTFKSKRVEAVQGNNFNLVGDLTMRGVTKEIALAVESTPIIKGMGGETRIGAHASGKLNRQDYGIKWNRALDSGGVVVSDEVQITLDLELVRDNKSVP